MGCERIGKKRIKNQGVNHLIGSITGGRKNRG